MEEIKTKEDLINFILLQFSLLGLNLYDAIKLLNHVQEILPSYTEIKIKKD